MKHRWLVEVPDGKDHFHDVGAEALDVDSGSLLFFADGRISVAYGPGCWKTVTYDGSEG